MLMNLLKPKRPSKLRKAKCVADLRSESEKEEVSSVEEVESPKVALESTELPTSDPTSSDVMDNINSSLKWINDRPTPLGYQGMDKMTALYSPLVPPMHLNQITMGTAPIQLEHPVDYVIIWSDQHDCCGFVRDSEDATEEMPLIMRFGGFWADQATRSMYMGCLVRVKSFFRVNLPGSRTEMSPILPRGIPTKDILFAGIPRPSAMACEWALLWRPRIHRSLGMVTKDMTFEHRRGIVLCAMVKDCEYDDEFIASSEKWDVPRIKKIPPVGTPVIINYVELTEPHIVFKSKDKDIPMPAYMQSQFPSKEIRAEGFLFAWLDLGMEPSRTYE